MAYTSTTFAALASRLAERLADAGMVFWTNTGTYPELSAYLRESIRVWGALTGFYRGRAVLSTTLLESFYDLNTVGPLIPTITTRELVADVQMRLMEPVTPVAWTGTEQFTLADVTGAIQRRRDQFLLETGQVITRRYVEGISPTSARVSLPSSIISLRRLSYADTFSAQYSTLWRDDSWATKAFQPLWPQSGPSRPSLYTLDLATPTQLILAPPPSDGGVLRLLSVETGPTVTTAADGVLLGVPDDWAWVVTWGALADLFGMAGIAADPSRATYCEQRWQQGVDLARAATRVLQATVNGQPVFTMPVADADAYAPGWENTVGVPQTLILAGLNLLGVPTAPGITFGLGLDVIAPATVPTAAGDLVQVPDEALDTVLDYAQHIASVKQGGGALTASQGLYERFQRACGIEVAKGSAEVRDASLETASVAKDEGADASDAGDGMSDFQRRQRLMEIRGLNLRSPQDQTPDEFLPYFQNIRCYQRGIAEARPGLTAVGSQLISARIHSLLRLSEETDGASQPFTRLVGAGTSLFAGAIPSGAAIDSGYSGDPLGMATFRPDPAVESFAYIADRQRQSKVSVAGQRTNWGSPGPLAPPTAVLSPPFYNFVATFDAATNPASTWQPVNAGAVVQVFPISDIIQSIWYEDTVTKVGWCNIVPVTQNGGMPYRAGAQFAFLKPDNLTINETAVIQEIKQEIPSTFIAGIIYDSGTSGPCSIVFTNLVTATDVVTPTDLVNNLLILNFNEHVRVLSATSGPDGTLSIRTSTLGTYAAGTPVSGVVNFRVYAQHTYTVSTLMQESAALSVIDGPPVIPQEGFQASIVQQVPHNLLNINGRPAQPDDLIHISINVRGLQNLVEGRIWFDVDGIENDFSKNYFFFPFTTPYLQAALQSTFDTSTAPSSVTSAIQTQVMDTNFNEQAPTLPAASKTLTTENNAQTPTPQQTTFGDNQWAEIVFRVNDILRFGADAARSLANVKATQISLTLTGPVSLQVASIWVGGSYGPDVADLGAPYLYRYRARSSASGARTNPSPPMRSGVTPNRQAITVSGAQHPDSQMDLLDIERFGGQLKTWQLVGSIPNVANWTYQDVIDDTDLAASVATERDAFQPYPTIDLPKTSQVNVAGTTVTRVSGDPFNEAWGEGTVVIINGLVTTLYAQPTSSEQFEIVDNLAALTNVTMTIQQADLLGQPMPSVWVHPDGWVMGCGCPQQPGTVFWTNRYNPDSTQDRYSLDLSDPSDPTIGGCAYEGRVFVFSRKTIFPLATDYASPQLFSAVSLPIGKGPVAAWCLASGDVMGFVHETGVYEFDGVNVPVCITDDLAPLFQRDGSPGVAVLGIGAPDFTHPELMQLTWAAGCWWFDYQDTDGNRQSLFYDRTKDVKGWWQDIYTPDVSIHYQEVDDEVNTVLVGGNTGTLYVMQTADPESNETDDGATIFCVIRTRCDDTGDTRLQKLFGDGMVDLATNNVPVSVQVGYNTYLQTLPTVVIPAGPMTDRYQVPIDVNGGDGVISPTFGVTICFTPGPQIFAWGWTLVPKVENTALRATDWDNAGIPGAKFVQGVLIQADTLGVDKRVNVEFDGGSVATPTLTINDTGEMMRPYALRPPIPYAHLLRLSPVDANEWRLLGLQFIFEPAPESVLTWKTQGTTFDLPGFKHVYRVGLAIVSTSDVTLTVTVDGVDFVYTVPSTVGAYQKVYVQLQAVKGKIHAFGLEAAQPFQVFQRDIDAYVMPWESVSPYTIAQPLGGPHRSSGAQI